MNIKLAAGLLIVIILVILWWRIRAAARNYIEIQPVNSVVTVITWPAQKGYFGPPHHWHGGWRTGSGAWSPDGPHPASWWVR